MSDNQITVTIIEVPGNRSAVVVNEPKSVDFICGKAGVEIDGRAIRVNSVEATSETMVTMDNSRITLSRGAKGNT
jgi:sRNA-binding carbon storage regulator CsrA